MALTLDDQDSRATFVLSCYRRFLKRDPETATVHQAWIDAIGTQGTHGVMWGIANSAEGQYWAGLERGALKGTAGTAGGAGDPSALPADVPKLSAADIPKASATGGISGVTSPLQPSAGVSGPHDTSTNLPVVEDFSHLKSDYTPPKVPMIVALERGLAGGLITAGAVFFSTLGSGGSLTHAAVYAGSAFFGVLLTRGIGEGAIDTPSYPR